MPWTGNANFAAAATFAIEQSLTKDWNHIWTRGHPFYRALAAKGTNWNRFQPTGTSLIVPVVGKALTNRAAAVSVANETTALSLTANVHTGEMTQAQYYLAHYRNNMIIRESDRQLAQGGQRGSFLEGMKSIILNDFKDKLSADIADSTGTAPTVASYVADRIPNFFWVIATANTVGGINQATAGNEDWRGQVYTALGAFSPTFVDNAFDAINALGRSTPDLVLASMTGAVNVLQKFRASISPNERYENADFTAKTGLNNFMFRGAAVVGDNRIGSGNLLVLSTDTWFVYMPEKPQLSAPQRIPGTDAYEIFASLWAGVACNDPACNAKLTGIT
ncbi:MAG: hypothetical protein WHU10_00070 [Fimbriimonadales bacterium]